ncbi:MAG: pyrroloquinoline quinone biosynthesis protein PqqE [Myxococcota bacterium]
MSAPRPYNLVAELTYRCPLRCPYCSNPVDYTAHRETLDADDWARVFREACDLGVVHVGLTGGEPALRNDLEPIVAAASDASLYTLLVTSGVGVDAGRLDALAAAGLRSVQLSFQDATEPASDRIAGAVSWRAKRELAAAVRERGMPLVLNVVLHRHNLDRIDEILALARELDADRLELANTQYHGWAWANREALLPTRDQLDRAATAVRGARRRFRRPELVYVLPDYYADRPKPCMGGWGRTTIVVTPDGAVQPCHEAGSIPGLEFWRVPERSLARCWSESPGMNAHRGEGWMAEPCRSCPERERDFGGCRCQAWRIAGDPAATDPACALSPHHSAIEAVRRGAGDRDAPPLLHRGARLD